MNSERTVPIEHLPAVVVALAQRRLWFEVMPLGSEPVDAVVFVRSRDEAILNEITEAAR